MQSLEQIFHDLNSQHFTSALPTPQLSWNSRLRSTAGRFAPGNRKDRTAEIEIAAYLRTIPESALHIRDTLLHEMVHYYLWFQKKPYGHTKEFHQILKRVGARRYNTVPKESPVKHWYLCLACQTKYPAKRKLGIAACASCCKRHNRGKYHEKFRLVYSSAGVLSSIHQSPEAHTPALPSRSFLSPEEIIRRLETLKSIITKKENRR